MLGTLPAAMEVMLKLQPHRRGKAAYRLQWILYYQNVNKYFRISDIFKLEILEIISNRMSRTTNLLTTYFSLTLLKEMIGIYII